MIEYRINAKSGFSPYLQIVQQTKHAMRMGLLRPGDRLPTVKEVVASAAINPNTVLKAYRALELEGLVEGRPGVGTFVLKAIEGPPARDLVSLRRKLAAWVSAALAAGLDEETISEMFESTIRDKAEERTA